MHIRKVIAAGCVAVVTLCSSSMSVARTKTEIDTNVETTLAHFRELNPQHADIEQRAAGVLVFPTVTKAGVAVAGEYGEGSLRVKGQTTAYYSVSAASVGVTLGLGKHSEIVAFMTQKALDEFTHRHGWAIGADAAIAVAKKGAAGEYDSETLKSAIIGFVFDEKGVIADVSLEGSKISRISPK